MGFIARKLTSEARRFGQKVIANGARSFGRKITSVAQQRGDQLAGLANTAASHADVAGLSGLSGQLRGVGHAASEVSGIARMLDANQPKNAVNRALKLIGKDY